ncbi:MAG: M23 family metallopeptidase [Burkholderiales bacterium]|nr:M23 family metallopeptidase [Burkholderiales bacterium]
MLALSGVVGAFATMSPAPDAVVPGQQIVREPYPIDLQAALLTTTDAFVREARFVRGDSLRELLEKRLGIDAVDAKRLTTFYAMHRLRLGTMVRAEVEAGGRFRRLSFPVGDDKAVTFVHVGEDISVSVDEARYEIVPVARAGIIRSSLFGAADDAEMPDSVAIQLADIFGGDIDFHRDLRKGDHFSVVFEMLYRDGLPVRTGRVLAAEFVNKGKALRAIYFATADSGAGGYYAPDGSNMRKAFLRSPLEFSRVSSGFGNRRHPIFNSWRAHTGVDYAAPTGTRVRATGDGVVEFAGRKGGYGNAVILRHGGQKSTLYAHLNHFARGIRRGVRVAQGESIGAVGQTGWATGPHVHYEFRIAGVARNPLTIALPAAHPVPAAKMAAFRSHAAEFVAQLDLLASTNLALLQ